MYQNENLQAACNHYLLLGDHHSFLTNLKASCINQGFSGKITQNYIKIAFSPIYPIVVTYESQGNCCLFPLNTTQEGTLYLLEYGC